VRENDNVAQGKNGEKSSHGPVYGRTVLKAQQTPGTIRTNRSL
jgi:hypothetical protein